MSTSKHLYMLINNKMKLEVAVLLEVGNAIFNMFVVCLCEFMHQNQVYGSQPTPVWGSSLDGFQNDRRQLAVLPILRLPLRFSDHRIGSIAMDTKTFRLSWPSHSNHLCSLPLCGAGTKSMSSMMCFLFLFFVFCHFDRLTKRKPLCLQAKLGLKA